ncbi:hypothetical protein BDQ17DRAFT_574364 [Cyathus striatus]|nr:hypothetical protein BDQ17DRAFT_574364 [Cyathus striatus]
MYGILRMSWLWNVGALFLRLHYGNLCCREVWCVRTSDRRDSPSVRARRTRRRTMLQLAFPPVPFHVSPCLVSVRLFDFVNMIYHEDHVMLHKRSLPPTLLRADTWIRATHVLWDPCTLRCLRASPAAQSRLKP